MENNCLDCLYANYSESWAIFKKLTSDDHFKCEHPNSPYYGEIVDENKTCRLFESEKDYFRNKDLREKIENLKRK
ncbi:MAG: hypothetical protein ACOC2W_02695 [bacterium]